MPGQPRDHRRRIMLTVDTGADHNSSRFYRLMVTTPGVHGRHCVAESVSGEILVPEGDHLRITHRYEIGEEAA